MKNHDDSNAVVMLSSGSSGKDRLHYYIWIEIRLELDDILPPNLVMRCTPSAMAVAFCLSEHRCRSASQHALGESLKQVKHLDLSHNLIHTH